MASSIFGGAFGATYDGTTFAVTGGVTTTGNIRASGGTVNVGASSSGISESASTLRVMPADGGAYLIVNNSGAGVAVNSAPLLLQSATVTQSRIVAPAANTINLTNAAGSGVPTLQIGGTPALATFGPSTVSSLTVAAGLVTAGAP